MGNINTALEALTLANELSVQKGITVKLALDMLVCVEPWLPIHVVMALYALGNLDKVTVMQRVQTELGNVLRNAELLRIHGDALAGIANSLMAGSVSFGSEKKETVQ